MLYSWMSRSISVSNLMSESQLHESIIFQVGAVPWRDFSVIFSPPCHVFSIKMLLLQIKGKMIFSGIALWSQRAWNIYFQMYISKQMRMERNYTLKNQILVCSFLKYDLKRNTSNLISATECKTVLRSKFASTIISANES